MSTLKESNVLAKNFGGGPHGLGDPEDTTLRKVEVQVLIPKLMREKAKTEKCAEEVSAFTQCCANNSLLMVISCQQQNQVMKECLERWYKDEHFQQECQQLYLKERSEFRRTGLPKKHRE